jgi:hypothetical protein
MKLLFNYELGPITVIAIVVTDSLIVRALNVIKYLIYRQVGKQHLEHYANHSACASMSA